jgi:outer membrane protein assembly factor BamB
MIRDRRLGRVLALVLLWAPAWAEQPNPDLESWGAYSVRHLPIGGIYNRMAVTKDGLIAAIALGSSIGPDHKMGTQLYFLRPDGRLVGQIAPSDSFQINNPPLPAVLLRNGTIAAVTDSGKVIFATPDGHKAAEYATPDGSGHPSAAAALRNGLLALGLRPAKIVLLDSRGEPRGEISGKAMRRDYAQSGVGRILETLDGRLLVASDYAGGYLSGRGGGTLSPWTINGERRVRPLLVLRSGSIVAMGRMGLVLAGLDGTLKKELDLNVAGTFHEEHGGKDRETLAGVVEMRDGGFAVTTMSGHLFVMAKDGRERWRIKVPGTIFSEALELKNGNFVVGTSASFLYFLDRNGALLGRYRTDNNVVVPPVEMEDGTIVAGTSMERGTSHNLYAFSPTGRPFIQAPPLSGHNCRVVGTSGGNLGISNAPCPDSEAFIDDPITQRQAEETCLRYYPDSRPARFHDFSCPTVGKDSRGRAMKNLILYFDCEVCSDAP